MKQLFVLFTMLIAICADAQYVFQSHIIMANTNTSQEVKDITHADIDNDGDLDLLCVDKNSVKWFENVDGQSSSMIEHVILEGNYKFISIADVDGDGDIDVISTSNSSIFLSLNVNGSGLFEDSILIFGTNPIQAVSPVDIDMDGDVDILYSSEGSSGTNWPFGWLENMEGDGPFVDHVILANSKVSSIGYLDIDGDGDMDLVTSAYIFNTTDILLYINDGNNNFTSQFVAENIPQRRTIYTRDLDGDGHEDIITSKSNSG